MAIRTLRPRRWLLLIMLGAAVVASGCTNSRFAGYDLPPEPARYKLVVDHKETHTTWEFQSSRVTEDKRPADHVCPEEMHAISLDQVPPPCRPEPLIFLRYDAKVGLDNAVRAGAPHIISVAAIRQATEAPRLAGLKLWFSTDSGRTWKPMFLIRVPGGDNGIGIVRYPKFADTTGVVSLKAEAWDAGNNRVTQTVDQAWFLKER